MRSYSIPPSSRLTGISNAWIKLRSTLSTPRLRRSASGGGDSLEMKEMDNAFGVSIQTPCTIDSTRDIEARSTVAKHARPAAVVHALPADGLSLVSKSGMMDDGKAWIEAEEHFLQRHIAPPQSTLAESVGLQLLRLT